MNEVKTYAVNCNDAWLNTKGDDISGSYVKYADYLELSVQLANTESKCREMAAELSAVDKIHNEAVFITDDHYEQCPPEVQKIIRSLAVLQIPACDAFMAEVRASGVEMMAAEADQLMNEFGDDSYKVMVTADLQRFANAFAAQLRKGAAL